MTDNANTNRSKILYRLWIGDSCTGPADRVVLKEEKDIIELRQTIHTRNELGGPPNQLEVYPPGTKVPVVHGTRQLEDDQLALLSHTQELIVVAPHPAKGQGQHGTPSMSFTPPPDDANIKVMQKFFDQDVSLLVLDAQRYIQVERMSWFDNEIATVYWRHCYSYILCSTVAFFEQVHKVYVNAKQGEDRSKNTMVLTGVQGTGKSILGAIIGLFMAKLFGWQVHYIWSDKEIWTGQPSDEHRIIHVVDLSRGEVQDFPSGFLLIVSSANSSRWSSIAQQQSWTEDDGNYCFIDASSEGELQEMATKRGAPAVAAAKNAFKYVGGVPRLCLQKPAHAKAKVDGAISKYGTEMLVNQLSILNDSSPPKNDKAEQARNAAAVKAGEKIYPGLVGHIIPTNSFRNHFELQIPSPYVGRKLLEKEDANTDDKLQQLMKTLLAEPKARSFGGWIWVPLLTMKMKKQQAHITIVGSTLPVDSTEPSVEVLLQGSASTIEFIEFKTMQDFLEKAKGVVGSKTEAIVFAKAESDTFTAMDAIIMIKRGGKFIIAALQLTVAEKHHSVIQSMIIEFVTTCKSVDSSAIPQLWFLQPEACLPYFGFVSLQAMEFDTPTFPTPPAAAPASETNATRRSGRKQQPKKLDTDFVPHPQDAPKAKMQSNDRNYWHEDVRSLPQYIGIVQIDSETTVATQDEQQGKISSAFKGALKTAAEAQKQASSSDAVDPTLRCWSATNSKMEELEGRIHSSLMTAIRIDIAADQQSLDDAGFVFSNES